MKNFYSYFVVLAVFGSSLLFAEQAVVEEGVIVNQAPPAPKEEVISVSPGEGHVWKRGFWRWHGNEWVWEPGVWEVAPYEGANWVEGGWVSHEHGWYWRSGHWDRDYWDGHHWNQSHWNHHWYDHHYWHDHHWHDHR